MEMGFVLNSNENEVLKNCFTKFLPVKKVDFIFT